MPATHTQIIKWTFPAFALIIGLLWYKRRRADRADPGGINKKDRCVENITDQEKKIAPLDSNSDFHDCAVKTSESYSLSPSNQLVEEIVCSPRKTSESLDIPQRKSGSPCISAHSTTPPNNDDQEWYSFVDTSSKMEIQLGSNPTTSNFDIVAKSRGASFLEEAADSDDKVLKIFENIVEEEEQKLALENNSMEVIDQNEENDTNNECSYLPSEEPSVTTPLKDNVKTPARTLSERDSANHSPVSGVLEGSVTDEARSEGSTDSGKGGSIKGHTKDTVMPMTYEFGIPQALVGRLIGRHGSFLQNIRHKAKVSIVVKRHPIWREQKLCVIEGSAEGINIALEIIRQKFPEKKYPHVTLNQIPPLKVSEDVPWVAELRQLSLVEGMNNDVVICHIVKPNRLFVQLPTHPTYPSLRILDEKMTQLYETTESPSAPDELTRGMILVAKWYNTWVRVYVEHPDPHGEQHLVRLVDHGGYWIFRNSEMRKIRSDYLTLPFQAIEIFLANVQPKDGEWTQEAYNTVAHMCSGIVGQAQIEGYINTSTYISLYLNIHKHGVISLADELIARGFAESIPLESIIPEEENLVISPWRWLIVVVFPIFMAFWGLRRKSVDISGAILGLFMGSILTLTSFSHVACLFAFLVSSTKATKFCAKEKKKLESDFKEGGQRNWIQVLCNGGMATQLGLLYLLDVGSAEHPIDFNKYYRSSWLSVGILGAFACCNGDTWASEIGTVVGTKDPFLITTLKRVPRGTNGGISWVGLLVSILGGITVGLSYYLTVLITVDTVVLQLAVPQWPIIIIGGIGGLFGSVIDSFLGAMLQYSGINEKGKIVEHPGKRVKHICGRQILDNHSVNLLSSVITALLLPEIAKLILST